MGYNEAIGRAQEISNDALIEYHRDVEVKVEAYGQGSSLYVTVTDPHDGDKTLLHLAIRNEREFADQLVQLVRPF